MNVMKKNLDCFFVLVLIFIIIGLPLGIRFYDRHVWAQKVPPGAKTFTLTGHARKGWLAEEVHAYDAIPLWKDGEGPVRPVIEVNKGDRVVFKLRSSDVVHGFSLKDFGIFINDGIQPGKSLLVSFTAEKTGSFIFSCNAICGENHQNMQGTLVVRA